MKKVSNIHKVAKDLFVRWVRSDVWDTPPVALVQGPDGEGTICVIDGASPRTFLAAVVAGYRDPEFPKQVAGIAILSEGWGLKAPTPEDVEWTKTNSLMDHPKAYEAKTLISYDGKTFKQEFVARGEEESHVKEKNLSMTGGVPNGLVEAFKALNS